jgi:hypothetical protein
MSEIDRPGNAKAAKGSVLTEIRRPRLLRLDPDVLREMAERTERAKESLVARTYSHRERDFTEKSK